MSAKARTSTISAPEALVQEIADRPATIRAYERAQEINTEPAMSEEAKNPLRPDCGDHQKLTAYAAHGLTVSPVEPFRARSNANGRAWMCVRCQD